MTRRSLLAGGFVAGFLLHTAAVLALWRGWAPGLRGFWLIWIDLPLSLAWADAPGPRVLAWSLTLGGLYWGLLIVLLVRLVGWLSRRRR